jgi:hypothetical protein
MKQKVRKTIAATPEEKRVAKEAKRKKLQAHIRNSGIPRDNRGRWLKGVSGNDLGRPRTALAELCRAQISKLGLVGVLGEIGSRRGVYKDKKNGLTISDQIAAIRLLLLYGFGQPKGEIDAGDVKIQVVYDNRNQIAIANAAPGAAEDHRGGEALQRSLLRPPLGQDDAGYGSPDPSGAAGSTHSVV